MTTAGVVRVGGACALMGVAAAFAGAVVGGVHGLGGQEIPLRTSADFASLVSAQSAYLLREWLFLLYAVFAIGEGVGLYWLTARAGGTVVWAAVAFLAGIVVAVVQDAALVGFVRQFPEEYRAADAQTRLALEPLARSVMSTISAQQTIANLLLGIGGALFSVAILRTAIASRTFGIAGLVAASASIGYAAVTAAAPRLDRFQDPVEHAFGLVVLWDLWAGLVMIRFHQADHR